MSLFDCDTGIYKSLVILCFANNMLTMLYEHNSRISDKEIENDFSTLKQNISFVKFLRQNIENYKNISFKYNFEEINTLRYDLKIN